jgi:hypothetical protein
MKFQAGATTAAVKLRTRRRVSPLQDAPRCTFGDDQVFAGYPVDGHPHVFERPL